ELFPKERRELVAAAIVRLQIQVDADDRKRARIPRSEAVELCGKLIESWHSGSYRNASASGQKLYHGVHRDERRSRDRIPFDSVSSVFFVSSVVTAFGGRAPRR